MKRIKEANRERKTEERTSENDIEKRDGNQFASSSKFCLCDCVANGAGARLQGTARARGKHNKLEFRAVALTVSFYPVALSHRLLFFSSYRRCFLFVRSENGLIFFSQIQFRHTEGGKEGEQKKNE